MAWTVWQQDLTDRKLEPIADTSGSEPARGLATLWQRTLEEGVHSDGSAKHVVFWIEDEPTKVRVQLVTAHPGKPEETLGRLRRLWRAATDDDRRALTQALGRFHAGRRGVAIDFFYKELHPLVAAAGAAGDVVKALGGR